MSQYNPDYSVIKKPGQDSALTEEQAKEWMKCALDPHYFMTTYCHVVGAKGKTLYEPRCYQKEIIENIVNNRHTINICGRQAGKCIESSSVSCIKITINGTSYSIQATMGELHTLSSCNTSDEAEAVLKGIMERTNA